MSIPMAASGPGRERDGTFDLCERTEEIVERTQVMGAAYFDIRFNAKAHSLPASRSPSLASPIITLAIASCQIVTLYQSELD